MRKTDIDKWISINKEIESILKYLAGQYIKIFNIDYYSFHSANISKLEVTLIDDWSGGPDYKYFKITPNDLICPNGVINRWKLNHKLSS